MFCNVLCNIRAINVNSNTLLHSTSRASIVSVKLVKFTWECAVAKRSKFEKAEIKLGSKNGLGLTMSQLMPTLLTGGSLR